MPTTRQREGAAKRKTKKKLASDSIQKTDRIGNILERFPHAADIFAMHGLHCAGCQFNESDSLEDAVALHGMSHDALDDLLADLHGGVSTLPKKPNMIDLTKAAAEALRETLDASKKSGWKLLVMTDESGGFCLEFIPKKSKDHTSFAHPDVPDVELVATNETLLSIGGSTIDWREGRFKLDVPHATGCACKQEGSSL